MSQPNTPSYDPHAVEARRQAAWRERHAFATPSIDGDRPRRYIKPSAPFTSGNVHIGHVRSYSIGDAYARFWRARGEDVLFAFGFDAFGLPAELGAIAGGEPPSDWVARCATHMRGQLDRLGYSFDWDRAFVSSDALMYRWSQWLFLTLLDAGLVYRGTGAVDWCDQCQTTLATIQVEHGLCWRCHSPVRLIQRPEWYLRISAYVPENDRRLDELAASGIWDEVALASQRFVLGRVDGVELDLRAPDDPPALGDPGTLTAFTPHADAVALARFVLISPKHPDIDSWVLDPDARTQLEDLRAGGLERGDRDAEAITVVDSGRTLLAPLTGEPLPLLVSPAVDGRFGATAVLGIPGRDRTDALIAQRLWPARAELQDAPSDQPVPSVPGVRPAFRYRAGDFSISRQRSWGTPIPIVYCAADCGAVPVPPEQLPVLLPLDLEPTGAGNPLAERADFVDTTCPRCGGPARRETDTLDCHFDALWLWVPVCVPPDQRERTLPEILALEDLRAWLPCERVVAGSDSGNFVFDQRIVTKALRDIGPLAFLADGEPFAGCLFHEMVIRDGRKMSKHLGNVVDPDELVARFGADTVRLATLYAARPQRSLNWSDSAVLRCHRFLTQVWDFSQARLAAAGSEPVAGVAGNGDMPIPGSADTPATGSADRPTIGSADTPAGRDMTEHLRTRLGKWCDTAVEKTTEEVAALEMHSAVRNVMRLFDRIKDYEKRVLARAGVLAGADRDALLEALQVLSQLLAPLAPHLAEELWIAFGNDPDTQMPWPGVSSRVPA
ncbi:MAG TPA: class I tRNA ligase family protein [Solirubrobacteraceae bacterium]|nr:class I tRNA ligase family protein [Solirubrobacteraceae bacterium]